LVLLDEILEFRAYRAVPRQYEFNPDARDRKARDRLDQQQLTLGLAQAPDADQTRPNGGG
jgi:hypothetical protein